MKSWWSQGTGAGTRSVWMAQVSGFRGHRLEVPVGLVTGTDDGPDVLVMAGVHGTEWLSQDVAAQTFRRLRPAAVRGRVLIVFIADLVATAAGAPALNPIDGKNVNRLWPGAEQGSYSERLAASIWHGAVGSADAVIDLHGGEWYEEVQSFAITHRCGNADLDRRCLAAATATGVKWVEVTEVSGEWLGRGTLSAEVVRSSRPALALEVGGRGRRSHREVAHACEAVLLALAQLGSVEGGPTGDFVRPTIIAGSKILRSPDWGLLSPIARVGDRVSEGQPFCRIRSFEGKERQTLLAPSAGVVMLRSVCRVVGPDSLVGKVGILPSDMVRAQEG